MEKFYGEAYGLNGSQALLNEIEESDEMNFGRERNHGCKLLERFYAEEPTADKL